MQQGEDADQRLVRVGVSPAPAPEEATLFGEVKVSPTKPHRDKLVSPLVGSTSTNLFLRAQPKNWREACRRRRRLEGCAPRNASISSTATTAHSCFDRSVAKKRARSRAMPRLCSMVMSLRGRVPALRARSRERTRWSAKAPTAGRRLSGTAWTRRCRRPAARRASWSRPKAKPSTRKNSSRDRANAPADRPERRERSKRA